MKIKVCGNTKMEQLRQLNDLGITYAGIIFYEGSPRDATKILSLQSDDIKEIPINKTGVFVNADPAFVIEKINAYSLHSIQLHGEESPEYCRQFADTVKVIKAFRIDAAEADIDMILAPYLKSCDYFLFDTKSTAGYGGTGQTFDWTILKRASIHKPFFLSGGIGLEHSEAVRQFQHPYLFAIDINSKFESAPGIKDIKKIQKLIEVLPIDPYKNI